MNLFLGKSRGTANAISFKFIWHLFQAFDDFFGRRKDHFVMACVIGGRIYQHAIRIRYYEPPRLSWRSLEGHICDCIHRHAGRGRRASWNFEWLSDRCLFPYMPLFQLGIGSPSLSAHRCLRRKCCFSAILSSHFRPESIFPEIHSSRHACYYVYRILTWKIERFVN